jgi:hypothetical protein
MFVNTGKDGVTREFMKGPTRGLQEGRMEGLSEVNARTESRRQNKLVGKFKIATSDLVSVRV